MSILYIMIPLSVVLTGFAVWAFFWAVGSGQFDDLESPGWDVLRDAGEIESGKPVGQSMNRAGPDLNPDLNVDLNPDENPDENPDLNLDPSLGMISAMDPDARHPAGENDLQHSRQDQAPGASQDGNRPVGLHDA